MHYDRNYYVGLRAEFSSPPKFPQKTALTPPERGFLRLCPPDTIPSHFTFQ